MINWKITSQYDGSLFYGFQRLTDYHTVQGEIERAIYRLTKEKVRLISAGRTDKGVHGKMQVSNFLLESKFQTDKLRGGINHFIAEGIQVTDCEKVPLTFNARYDCRHKTYKYILCNKYYMEPWYEKYKGHRKYNLNYEQMIKAVKLLEGDHDFSAFATDLSPDSVTYRRLDRLYIEKIEDDLIFTCEAKSFLRNMVRILVGTTVDVGRGAKKLEDIKRAFKTGNRKDAGHTIEANGLYLWKLIY